ncbi:flagellar hook-length control protein FliK [Rhodocyclaceae bacterium SMB388]
MIPADLAARLRMLTEASFFDSEPPVQGTAKVREIQARLPQLLPGQQFTATIQRPLPDGTFQAVVAGREYTLALNHAAKAGDSLELVVTQNTPRAVFAQLANTAPTGAGTEVAGRPALSPTGQLISFLLTGQPTPQPLELAAGRPLLSAPPTVGPANAAPGRSAQSAGASASPALQAVPTAPSTAAATPGPAATLNPGATATPTPGPAGASGPASPTLAAAAAAATTPSAAALAPLLKQALGQSGLFYESHQLRWLSGRMDTTMLMREPQNQFAQPRAGTLPSGSGQAETARGAPRPAGGPASAPAAGLQSGIARMGSTQAAITGINEATEADGRSARLSEALRDATRIQQPTIPERLTPLVHQQLDSMATQHYLLYVQAWPGQRFEWEIEDPAQEGRREGDETPDEWNTTLRLTMPRLGSVEARIHLTAAGVALRLAAQDAASASALESARAQLESALAAAGVALTGFIVERAGHE